MIEIDDITVRYGAFTALRDLSMEIRAGEFFTLLGPSGCGKTTALRTLAGFVEPARGELRIDGRRVDGLPPEKRRIGMVFQNYALFPGLDVGENIAFGLRVERVGAQEREERVREIARRVDLAPELLRRGVAELSGGQQQRVAVARALVLRPKILLLDEPLSNLDAALRVQLRRQLKELQVEFGITTVYVTHDQDEALSMSDRIAVFDSGRLAQVGTPEEVHDRPATASVCRFVGDSSPLGPRLRAHLLGGEATDGGVAYVRPERVEVVDDTASVPGAVPARVLHRRYHGSHVSYIVESMDTELQVIRLGGRDAGWLPGDDLAVRIAPANLLRYDTEGAPA